MEGEEDKEGDTDEETVSVTSSSQDSADKIRYQKWGDSRPVYRSSVGGLPEDQNGPSGGGVLEKALGDLGAIGARGKELDPQERMGPLDLWELLALEDFLEGMGYLPPWDPLPLLDYTCPDSSKL